jgi:hypothetical protein
VDSEEVGPSVEGVVIREVVGLIMEGKGGAVEEDRMM